MKDDSFSTSRILYYLKIGNLRHQVKDVMHVSREGMRSHIYRFHTFGSGHSEDQKKAVSI